MLWGEIPKWWKVFLLISFAPVVFCSISKRFCYSRFKVSTLNERLERKESELTELKRKYDQEYESWRSKVGALCFVFSFYCYSVVTDFFMTVCRDSVYHVSLVCNFHFYQIFVRTYWLALWHQLVVLSVLLSRSRLNWKFVKFLWDWMRSLFHRRISNSSNSWWDYSRKPN